jgi:hypothetical protein
MNIQQHLRSAFLTGQKNECDIQLRRTDGSGFWAHLESIAIKPGPNQLQCCTMAFRDITREWRAEKVLRETEQHLALAVGMAKIGLFEWNLKTGQIFWTDQTSRLHGLPAKEQNNGPLYHLHTYREWAECVHAKDLQRVEGILRHCMRKGLPFDTRYRVVWPNGAVHWLRARGVFVPDKKGKPERMLGVDMDISERLRLEEALRESEARYKTLRKVSGRAQGRNPPRQPTQRDRKIGIPASEFHAPARTSAGRSRRHEPGSG